MVLVVVVIIVRVTVEAAVVVIVIVGVEAAAVLAVVAEVTERDPGEWMRGIESLLIQCTWVEEVVAGASSLNPKEVARLKEKRIGIVAGAGVEVEDAEKEGNGKVVAAVRNRPKDTTEAGLEAEVGIVVHHAVDHVVGQKVRYVV